jgi:CheY-like chemotaxis protein
MTRATQILVVDDDADFSAVLRDLLQDEGCTVREAADGREALRILHGGPLPHLILFDLRMPVMNGWQFHDELQREPALAAIPVAVLSAISCARPCGAMHVLHKPIDLQNLLGLLHAIEAPDRPPASGWPHLF